MATKPTHGRIPASSALTETQLDGLACVECGEVFQAGTRSVPVGEVDGAQVFACTSHGDREDEGTDEVTAAESAAALDRLAAKHGLTEEVAAIRAFSAKQTAQDEQDARARRVAENVLYLARRGPAVQQLADANRAEGRTGVADALDAVADAHDRLADAVDYGGDWIAAVGAIRDASARAAARAQEADNTPPLVTVNGAEGRSGGFLIPPPADPVMRAEWEAGAAAREAAGLSGFVGEDYPAEDGR